MKKLAFILCLMAGPVLADDHKPPMWVMAVQLSKGPITVPYTTEAACRDAVKLIGPHIKKIGHADCLPVLQQ